MKTRAALLPVLLIIVLATTSCASIDDMPLPTPSATLTATVTGRASELPSSTPPILQGIGPGLVDEGRLAYVEVCAACHGLEGEGYGNELSAPALDSSEHASDHTDQQIHDWIVNGKLGIGRQMPGFRDHLDDRQVHAIIAYLHTLWTDDQLKAQQDFSTRWPATPEPLWTTEP